MPQVGAWGTIYFVDYMWQALSLARLALGQVSPNPAVGAVVVRDGEVVGQGFTHPPGSAHAEVMALRQAGGLARGAIMYISLEPCGHFGRTPPCTQAIIQAGVREVHMAMLDPNPLVFGRGRKALEEAGIKTFVGEHEAEAREINEAYLKFVKSELPFVIFKYAMSLDGKIATRTGNSKWISGTEARAYAHCLRACVDAIMVGAGTVLADDPRLTCRLGSGRGGTPHRQPLRIIIDGRGRVPVSSRVFNEPGATLLVTEYALPPEKEARLCAKGAHILTLPSPNGGVDVSQLMRRLGEQGITSVLVEGGGVLFGSLLDVGMVDKVMVFVSPLLIGGAEARIAIAGRGIDRLTEATYLEKVKMAPLGQDIMFTGYVAR